MYEEEFNAFENGMVLEKVRKEYGVKRISSKLLEKVKAVLESEVETFNHYINAEVYEFTLYHNDEEVDSLYINMDFLGLNLAQVPTRSSDWKAYIIPVLFTFGDTIDSVILPGATFTLL